jgi:squalene-hopene/tetraprenyl-beta-curcumene cyclase
MRRLFHIVSVLVVLVILGTTVLALPQSNSSSSSSRLSAMPAASRQEGQRILNRALDYLRSTQNKEDGSWQGHEGITGLATIAFLQQPGGWARDAKIVEPALKFLASRQKEDGSVWTKDSPPVNTAIAITAFRYSGKKEYEPHIKKGQAFLVLAQFDEGEGVKPTDHGYGGVGYNAETRSDLKNLHHVMEAMKATELPKDNPFWDKAIQFLKRTQNLKETNDQAWAGDDGGFVYRPGFSFAGETRSYGSMSYSGILSMTYADLKKTDPRVQAVSKWIRSNYTLEENPGLGKTTLYYYYMVFAKGLRALGETSLVDAKGQKHDWREELVKKLTELQKPEGYWVNLDDPSYWQDNKDLVTAFTSTALNHVLNDAIR